MRSFVAVAATAALLSGYAAAQTKRARTPAKPQPIKPSQRYGASFAKQLPKLAQRRFRAARKALTFGKDAKLVRVPADYASLQEAIDAVADGGTIEVTGTVKANATIDRDGLKLRIRGATGSKIESAGGRGPVIDIVNARSVKLEDVWITDGQTGLRHRADGFLMLSKTVIADNGYGVRLDAPGKLTQIVDSHVRDNTKVGVYATGASLFIGSSELTSNGINALVRDGRGLLMSDTVVADAVSETSAAPKKQAYPPAGMIVHHDSDTVWIQSCTFEQNKGAAGLYLDGVTGADIVGGKFFRNHGPGLLVANSKSVKVKDASLTKNMGPGLRARDSEVWVYRVESSGNRIAGIQMSRGTLTVKRTKLENNRPKNEKWGVGLIALEGGRITLDHVVIRNNRLAGLSFGSDGCDSPAAACALTATKVQISGSQFGLHGNTCGAKLADFHFSDLEHSEHAEASILCPAPDPEVPTGTPVLP